jgi:NCS1 nucleoside transporter family
MTASTPGAKPAPESVERRTIEHIPVDERHGRARDLFTVWFGSNIMLLTIITGALATTVFGLPLWAGALSVVLGNVVGAVVMALHAAQGPQMGVPQMLQTRAQFGSYGSLLVVVLVVFMYLGFFASNAVLGGQALAKVTGLPSNWAIVVIGLISVIATMVGYRLIHRVTAILSVVAGGALVVAFVWMIGVNGVPDGTWHTDGFTWAGFMATLSVAALWQIAYAPYVSDYTRYMPRDTGQRAAFWGTYSGCVLGSVLPMLLGVLVGAALPDADTMDGLSTLTHGVSTGVFAIFAVGITATNAMNLYCGTLSTITVGQNVFPKWNPRAGSRAAVSVVLFVIALIPALVSADDFLANYANFLALLLCVLIPWTAVNLVDYYLLRHGHYDIEALFERDGGRYGRFNWVAIGCYFAGILVQIPFLSTTLFTGFIASAIGGVDISWIVGLAVICPLYYVLMKPRMQAGDEAGAARGVESLA